MLGPVFRGELLTTSRRRRYYVLRSLYAAILLLLILVNYNGRFAFLAAGGAVPIQLMSQFAQWLFSSFATAQVVAVFCLTPALVGGVIAVEKHRKTLHYLLASELTSGEIVLGKLAARLLYVGMYLAVALPIFSLLTLFGGIDPVRIGLVFGGTITTAFFLAGLSLLASTFARRPRGAITFAYGLTLGWVFLPFLIVVLVELFPRDAWWLPVVLDYVYPGFALILELLLRGGPRTTSLVGPALWMAGSQVAWGVACVAVSALRLRPIARSQEGRPRWELRLDKQGRRRWQLRHRPPIGRDAMIWKERYTARVGGVARLAALFAFLCIFVFIFCLLYESFPRAMREMIAVGIPGGELGPARSEFHGLVGSLTGLLYTFWLLGTAITAAAGISGERDGDTWISLIATDLTGWEILRAKFVGAIWRFRVLGYVLAILWGLGLACGAVHPLGVICVLIETLAFLSFASALGTYCSLRSRTSTQSLVRTVGALLVLNGLMLLCVFPSGPIASLLSTPYLVSYSLLSYTDIRWLLGQGAANANPAPWFVGRSYGWGWQSWLVANFYLIPTLILLYIAATAFLLIWSALRFDRAVDRPRRAVALPTGPNSEHLNILTGGTPSSAHGR